MTESTDLQKLKQEAEEASGYVPIGDQISYERTLIRRLLDAVEGLEKEVALAKASGLKAVGGLATAIRVIAQERQRVAALREVLEEEPPWNDAGVYPGDWSQGARLDWYQIVWNKVLAQLTEAPTE